MFRGVLSGAGRQWRSERRLAAVVNATNKNSSQKWTHRICKTNLLKQSTMRMKKDEKRRKNRPVIAGHNSSDLSHRDVEFLRRQQDEALGEERSRVGGSASASAYGSTEERRHRHGSPASSRHIGYDSVDSTSGRSIIQQRFDALVYEALLRYGPPLPPEFVSENDIVSPFDAGNESNSYASSCHDKDAGAYYFYDEVQLKPQELFNIIRRLDPSFSVHTHVDSVPFSLLIKNSPYFRVWGGKVHFMRSLKRVPFSMTNKNEEKEKDAHGKVTITLSKYKMRESPSFDGLRQGPQPWLYNYRMV